ncbi:MAG: flagellar filament capping protein FliD [Myxococcota bacterium]
MDSIGSFGPRVTFSGLASGLDTGVLIQALLDFERRPLNLLEARKSDLESGQSLLRDLNQRLLTLREAARAIDNRTSGLTAAAVSEELLSYKASSSDESLIEVEAGDGAQPGTSAIRIDQLANVARRVSAGFTDADQSIATAAETLTIDFGAGQQISLAVPAGTTLNGLRDLINQDASNDGSVRADVLFDGSGYRLTVSGVASGAANDVTVTTSLTGPAGGAFIDAALGQNASDAQLVYLGIPVTRASNDITDLIPGVTLRLRGAHDPASPTDTVDVDVSRDDDAIAAKLTALVDAYNAVRDFSLAQSAVDPNSDRGGLLSGDALVRGVEQRLQLTLGGFYSFTGNSLGSLGQIGIRFDSEGRLGLDQEVMRAALDADPLAVRELLSGDGTTDGVATALARVLEPIVRTGDGTLALRDAAIDQRIESFEQQIERFEARLEKREESLLLQFSRLETLISSFQGQSSFLASLTANSNDA